MRGSFKVTGFGDVLVRLRNVSEKVSANARHQMEAAGARIEKNAKEMTPEDTGNLASTIQRDTQYEVDRRGRKTVIVTVGGVAADGTDTSQYALEIHENYDDTHMGPRTLAKQATTTLKIGRHFLTRAHEMERGRIDGEIEFSVRKAIREAQ